MVKPMRLLKNSIDQIPAISGNWTKLLSDAKRWLKSAGYWTRSPVQSSKCLIWIPVHNMALHIFAKDEMFWELILIQHVLVHII
jgi:hypothetical protein